MSRSGPGFLRGGEHTGDLLTPHWQELRPLPVNASHQSLRSRRSQYEFQPFSRSPDFTPRNRSSSPPQSPLGHTPLSGLGIQNLSASRSLPPPVEQNNNSPFTRALPTPPLGMHSGLAQMTIGSTQSLQGTMKSIPIINETEISGSEDGFDTSGLRTTVHISPDNCFVRCPKITFLVDPEGGNDSPGGRALECQICRVSTLPLILRPASSPKIKSDTRPAILPCGHVFGHRCLSQVATLARRLPVLPLEIAASRLQPPGGAARRRLQFHIPPTADVARRRRGRGSLPQVSRAAARGSRNRQVPPAQEGVQGGPRCLAGLWRCARSQSHGGGASRLRRARLREQRRETHARSRGMTNGGYASRYPNGVA
ncbi:CCA tRNA nucleotidyltransferase- mitochondrial [Apiospora arundinis]